MTQVITDMLPRNHFYQMHSPWVLPQKPRPRPHALHYGYKEHFYYNYIVLCLDMRYFMTVKLSNVISIKLLPHYGCITAGKPRIWLSAACPRNDMCARLRMQCPRVCRGLFFHQHVQIELRSSTTAPSNILVQLYLIDSHYMGTVLLFVFASQNIKWIW